MWRLRLPFRPVHEVTDFPSAITLRAERGASISPNLPYIVLNLDEYPSEADAKAALPRAFGAVMVASLIAGQGFQVETQLDRLQYPDDPMKAALRIFGPNNKRSTGPVDAIADGNFPVAVPLDRNVVYLTAGDVTVRQSTPAARLSPLVEQALAFPNLDAALLNDRLRIAFELWTDYHQERSGRAKFLTLVMALEVLAPVTLKHESAVRLATRWEAELADAMSGLHSESEEHEALESIGRELIFRKETSIRSRVRAHVLHVIGNCEPKNARAIATKAVRAYDLRSKLVHEGSLSSSDFEEGHSAAREAVRALLLGSLNIPPASVGA